MLDSDSMDSGIIQFFMDKKKGTGIRNGIRDLVSESAILNLVTSLSL